MSSWFIRRANVSTGGSDPGRLPPEYRELAYLQSDKNQYIDTGIVSAINHDVTVDMQLITIGDGYVFGRYARTAQYYLYMSASGGNHYQFGWSCAYLNVTDSTVDTNRHTFRLYSNGTTSYMDVDGVNIGSKASANHSGNTQTLTLFKGGGASLSTGSQQKVYSCKIVNTTTQETIMELVPALRKSDSEAGMYDLVSGNFLTNQGSGSFSYGEL